ncbi:MAG: co-regulatory protein PtrA N-terminal domain-containing protein, partial [Pseudomonadales bacterium]
MKSIKALLVVTALSISSLAMAEGGADRTFARMEQARQTSLEAYRVAQQQKVEA